MQNIKYSITETQRVTEREGWLERGTMVDRHIERIGRKRAEAKKNREREYRMSCATALAALTFPPPLWARWLCWVCSAGCPSVPRCDLPWLLCRVCVWKACRPSSPNVPASWRALGGSCWARLTTLIATTQTTRSFRSKGQKVKRSTRFKDFS